MHVTVIGSGLMFSIAKGSQNNQKMIRSIDRTIARRRPTTKRAEVSCSQATAVPKRPFDPAQTVRLPRRDIAVVLCHSAQQQRDFLESSRVWVIPWRRCVVVGSTDLRAAQFYTRKNIRYTSSINTQTYHTVHHEKKQQRNYMWKLTHAACPNKRTPTIYSM